ncbi:MAG: (2Fe-2S)-binding protein [Alphaproteobacteria bacterium]|nr:(2Fe-2S)-binding protein [Alphaproteobacteria bacterium]
MTTTVPITLTINGALHQAFVQPWHTLLHVLRDVLHFTGTKRGCNQGICGACSVIVDGEVVRGCLSIAANCQGRTITTIEGLANGNTLSNVQQAFLELGAVQCGYCMPGMIIAATALLKRTPKPTEEEIREGLSGNLCRCSGYVKVVRAVQVASERGTS